MTPAKVAQFKRWLRNEVKSRDDITRELSRGVRTGMWLALEEFMRLTRSPRSRRRRKG